METTAGVTGNSSWSSGHRGPPRPRRCFYTNDTCQRQTGAPTGDAGSPRSASCCGHGRLCLLVTVPFDVNPLKTRPPVTGQQRTWASEGQGAPGLHSAREPGWGACE